MDLVSFPLWNLYYHHGFSFVPIVESIIIMGLVLWNLYYHHGFSFVPIVESVISSWV